MRKRGLTITVLAAVLSMLVVLQTPGKAHAAEPDPIQGAATHLYTCLQTAETVNVLFMMDYSKSLNLSDKDPQGFRFDALRTALGGLTDLRNAEGRTITVEAAVSGFARKHLPVASVVPWTLISGEDSMVAIDSMVDQARRSLRPTGDGTDFQRALEGAAEDLGLDQRVADCRLMFWFTDGEFTTANDKDITDGNPGAAEAINAAREAICTPGTGVIDRLRKAGVVVLGLQLGTKASDLRRMSMGTFLDDTCGTYPIPDDWAPGGYLQAGEAGDLVWIFGQMKDMAQGCTPTGDLGGQVDPGIGRFTVRVPRQQVQNPLPATEPLTLLPPGRAPIEVQVPGAQEADGFTVESDHDAGQVGARVTLPSQGAAGLWQVESGFDAKPATYCVSADLGLIADPASEPPTAGETSALRMLAVRPDGTPVNLGVFKEAAVVVDVIDAHGSPIQSATEVVDGRITTTLTPDLLTARVTARYDLTLTTASGLRLAPVVAEVTVATRSDLFPSVIPSDRLNLGSIDRLDTASGELRLIGARLGNSRVCLGEPGPVDGPVAEEEAVLAYESGCFDLGPGEERTVPVAFTPTKEAVGSGRTLIPVTLHSAVVEGQEPAEQRFDLPVAWHQNIPVSLLRFGLLTALLVLASLLAVWFALFLATWLSTRFRTKGLMVGSADVLVTMDRILPVAAADGKPGPIDPNAPLVGKLRSAIRSNPRRLALSDGSGTLIARSPIWPWQVPTFTAEVGRDRVLWASSSQRTYEGGRVAPVPPGLGFVFILTARRTEITDAVDQGAVRARLHVFCTDKASSEAERAALLAGQSPSRILEDWQKAAGSSGTDRPAGGSEAADNKTRNWNRRTSWH